MLASWSTEREREREREREERERERERKRERERERICAPFRIPKRDQIDGKILMKHRLTTRKD